MSRWRLWKPKGANDYLWLVLVGLSLLVWVGLFLDEPVLYGLGIGVAPASAISAYWWQKQAQARTKLISLLIWMKEAPFERDYQEVTTNMERFTRVDALTIIGGHARYGARMRQAAERAERDLEENAWTPY